MSHWIDRTNEGRARGPFADPDWPCAPYETGELEHCGREHRNRTPRSRRELEEWIEDYGYNGAIKNSGWPLEVFLSPENARPSYAQQFRQADQVALVGTGFELVVEFEIDSNKGGRLLKLKGIEVGGLGDDLIWRLRVVPTDDGGQARNNDKISDFIGNIGSRSDFERLLLNAGRDNKFQLLCRQPAAAGRVVQGVLWGWCATVHGAGPVTSGYELP